MRRLIWILIWLGLIYSGYWFVVSQALQGAPDRAAAVLAGDGVDLSVGSVATTGYPSQFTTTISEPRLTGPDWTWQGPQMTLRAASYNPLAVAVVLPSQQSLTLAGQNLQVTSQDWQIDVALRPTLDLALDAVQVATGPIAAVSDADWQTQVARLQASLIRQDGQDRSYDADIDLAGLVLPATLAAHIDPTDALGPEIAALNGVGQLVFAAPLDRRLQGRMPMLDRITLDEMQLDWGPVTVNLAGTVTIDAAGLPSGQFTAQTGQWQIVLDVLTQAGVVDTRMAGTITRLAGFMAGADGVLSVPVVFRDGVMLIGPVPVGPAPRLR